MSKIIWMLDGISIYTTNDIWRKILSDFGAIIIDDSNLADVNFDLLDIKNQISLTELKSIILNAVDKSRHEIIKTVLKKHISLPNLQTKIIMILFKTGGISMDDMKTVMGYSPDIATHTIDTAIYQLRRVFGRDFIKNENGKYFIGE